MRNNQLDKNRTYEDTSYSASKNHNALRQEVSQDRAEAISEAKK